MAQKKFKKSRRRFEDLTQSRHKAFEDQRRKPLNFLVGDKIFLKVSPIKEMVCVGKKNKLDT